MFRRNHNNTKIFAEQRLSDFLESQLREVLDSIESEKDDYLLNVNEDDYIEFKESQAHVDNLDIFCDDMSASSSEQLIPAEYFPSSFFVRQGKSYKKDVIKFHIPYSGNSVLLKCMPSSRILWTMNVELNGQEICFEVINFNDDVDSIKRDMESNIRSIKQQLENVRAEVSQYNSSLVSRIITVFEARKARIKASSNVLLSLGVPVKKSSMPSPTFSVPAPQKRKKVAMTRPVVNETSYKPEPCLANSVYNDILRLLHDVGKEFERLPSLYAGKEEEHLRDHFLMMLEPNFDGSATGETFNKTGKTDILLRHEGSNVFIAECKFWRGLKSFLKTISQLMGYLTWRDSKAAIIMFVPNKDFTTVIETVKQSIDEHPNFLKYTNEVDETWLNYEFHLNDDRNRTVQLAVMLYHIPKS